MSRNEVLEKKKTASSHCYVEGVVRQPLFMNSTSRLFQPSQSQRSVSHSARNFVADFIGLDRFRGFCSLDFCFCLHCHSISTGMNCHRSNSGQRQSKKAMCVSWWHCQSIKSLSLVTPLVRMRRSSGGQPAVYKWSSSVFVLIVSGFRSIFTGDAFGW